MIDRKKAFYCLLCLAPSLSSGSTLVLENAIDSARSKVRETKSFINLSSSQVTSIENDTNNLEAEIVRYNAASTVHDHETKRLSQENAVNVSEMSSIAKYTLGIERDLAEQLYKKKNIIFVIDRFQRIRQQYTQISTVFDQAIINYRLATENHLDWIALSESHVATNVPDFDQIVDLKSYNSAYSSIISAWRSFPGAGKLIYQENQLSLKLDSIELAVESLQDQIRTLSASIELATYRKIAGDGILGILQSTDTAQQKLVFEITRLRESLRLARMVREKFVFDIVYSWLELIKVRLNLLNIDTSVQIVSRIKKILSGSDVINNLRANINIKKSRLTQMVNNLSPRKALVQLEQLELYLTNVKTAHDSLSLPDSMSQEINAMLLDEKSSWAIYQTQIESMLNDLSVFLNERKKWVAKLSYKNRTNSTPKCKKLADKIQNNNIPDLASESDYLKYRSECS